MEIRYNEPVEVTQAQYIRIMSRFGGHCFGRQDKGKFFIKLGLSRYKKLIEKELES